MGVIWRTFFNREVVHNVQRSGREGGGFKACFDCLEWVVHVCKKVETNAISDILPVLGEDIDVV